MIAGRFLDDTDGLVELDPDELIKYRDAYRKAWLSWQGLPDDPAAQP
ncbi:MAG: hypothetical protein ACRC1K_04835 [Planctomycetia bacterium]